MSSPGHHRQDIDYLVMSCSSADMCPHNIGTRAVVHRTEARDGTLGLMLLIITPEDLKKNHYENLYCCCSTPIIKRPLLIHVVLPHHLVLVMSPTLPTLAPRAPKNVVTDTA